MRIKALAVLVVMFIMGCKFLNGSDYPEPSNNYTLYQNPPKNCEGKDRRFIVVGCDSSGNDCSCEDRLPSDEDEADYCRLYAITIHKSVADTCKEKEERVCSPPKAVSLYHCRQDCVLFQKCAESSSD